MNTNHIVIGCLGDSLTDGYPGYSSYNAAGPDEQSQYQYRLKDLITRDFGEQLGKRNTGITFINRGVCGELTAQIKPRLFPEIIDESRSKYEKNPDIVIIVGGTNDVGWSIEPSVIAANLIEMHNSCKKEGIISIGATVPPSRFETEPDYNNRKLCVINEILNYFKMEKVAYAELYGKMGDASRQGSLKPAFDTGDGLHFSPAGYRKMAEIIYEDGFKDLFQSLIESE